MGQEEGSYVVARLTRADALPGTVPLEGFLRALDGVAFETGRSTILVLDPSAAAGVREQGLEHLLTPMTVVQSPSYVEMLALVEGAGAVVTNACEVLDSATVVGVPYVAIGDFAVGRSTILNGAGHVSADELDRLPEAVLERPGGSVHPSTAGSVGRPGGPPDRGSHHGAPPDVGGLTEIWYSPTPDFFSVP